MKRYELIEITWVDSDHGSGWQVVADMNPDNEAMLCKSVGYLFDETPIKIRLCQSHGGLGTPHEQVNGLLSIPKVAIKRRRRLK